MSTLYDPTNANAIPGPSRFPYAASTAPPPPPPPPSAPSLPSTSLSAAALPPPSQPVPPPQPPRRSANGPVIVPTTVDSDGVRMVPSAFEHCEVDDLIALIASMLDRLIQHNDQIPLTSNSLTRFHSRAPPNISVREYLVRIARYTNVEPCCLLILLPYVDKVCARITSFTVSSLTVHRFIIAGISVGSKALSDAFCTNGRYARVGGVSIVEMNLLEKEFCEALDWRLTTSGPVLAHYYTSLVRSHPNYRLSTAALPVPPTPPPIAIPAPFSPPPFDPTLHPVSPSVAFSSAGLAMDVDSGGGSGGGGGGGEQDDEDSEAGGAEEEQQTPMSTEQTTVDLPSTSSPPSPPLPPVSASRVGSVSPSSSSSAYTNSASTSASVSLNPSPRTSPRGRERSNPSMNSAGFIPHPFPSFPAAPPLIPPRLVSTASASHLPSPARSAPAPAPSPSSSHPHPPPPPSSSSSAAAALSPRIRFEAALASSTLSSALASSLSSSPSSPAKRPRVPSTDARGSPLPGGAGVGTGEGAGEGAARSRASPRLDSSSSAVNGGGGRKGMRGGTGEGRALGLVLSGGVRGAGGGGGTGG